MIYISLSVLIIIGLFLHYNWSGIVEVMEEARDYEHDVNEDTNHIIQKGE